MEKISSIEDLLNAVREAVGRFGETWWRGQPAGKHLIPGAYRNGASPRMERLRLKRFMQKVATRYQEVPGSEEYAEWLFLMQHHRLPTRLLDWTESPLIACFFAVLGHRESDACLWALGPIGLNLSQFPNEFLGQGLARPDDLRNFLEMPFGEEESDNPGFQRIVAVLTPETNVRMLQQQSAFTLHGTRTPLDELPESHLFLKSFMIPAAARDGLAKNLLWLGIRESSLFPDLDHLAAETTRLIGPTA